MSTGSFSPLDIDSQAIANHHCFTGIAAKYAHSLLQQQGFWFTYYLRCQPAACFDGGSHCAASRQEASYYRKQRVPVDGDKVRACTYRHYCSRQFFIVKMAVKSHQDDISPIG